MSRAARFKQSDLLRAIEAVQKAGLPVAGAKIEPDGTIIVVTSHQGGIAANDRNPLDRVLSR